MNKSTESNKTRNQIKAQSQTIKNLAINKSDTEQKSVFHKRLNCDLPIFARVKYLCDYGIDNCNPVLLLPVC
jgi:hypothetical protein